MAVLNFLKRKKRSTPVLPFQEDGNDSLSIPSLDRSLPESSNSRAQNRDSDSTSESSSSFKSLVSEKAADCGDRSTVHG